MPRPDSTPLVVAVASDLDQRVIAQSAVGAGSIVLADALLTRLAGVRGRALDALASGGAVYGVNTGMGALSWRRLDASEQAGHQAALLVARAVGCAPWLTRTEARAVLAARLRTLLNGDAAVSVEVCRQLCDLLRADVLPAIPRTGLGGAGEVIALAHLAGPLVGDGAVLDAGDVRPARVALSAAGLAPVTLGPKDGVALLQGAPVTVGLSVLRLVEVRRSLAAALQVFAAECALTAAALGPLLPAATRADDVLARTNSKVRGFAGTPAATRSLQAPVSFRVTTQVLAHVERSVAALDDAVGRALDGVTDSPAFVDDVNDPSFVGTAGFSGYDLAVHLGNLTVAVVAATEIAATRLHRLMDPTVTGLSAQLAAEPGPDTGPALVHKRAAGIAHDLRRSALASVLGPIETSAGQEDVQSFSIEAAEALRVAVHGWTDVLACELLVVHQMRTLGAVVPDDAELPLLARVAQSLPWSSADRRWGEDLVVLRDLLTHEQGPSL